MPFWSITKTAILQHRHSFHCQFCSIQSINCTEYNVFLIVIVFKQRQTSILRRVFNTYYNTRAVYIVLQLPGNSSSLWFIFISSFEPVSTFFVFSNFEPDSTHFFIFEPCRRSRCATFHYLSWVGLQTNVLHEGLGLVCHDNYSNV